MRRGKLRKAVCKASLGGDVTRSGILGYARDSSEAHSKSNRSETLEKPHLEKTENAPF